jgi:hypothetical protein
MKRTFNTKIIIFTVSLILVTIAVSSVYITESVKFEHKDFVFLPLIVGLLLTLIRTYNNITEKNKIVQKIAMERENSLDQSKIKFNTCPDYWTKETKEDAVYCKNTFKDSEGKMNLIGGPLKQLEGNIDEKLIPLNADSAKNIGFQFAHKNENDVHTFEDHDSTYVPSLRKSGDEEVIESFEEGLDDHDAIPHKHTRTFVDYAHTNKPVTWKDGEDREHDATAYKDSNHLLIYNEDVYHDHSGNGNLYDAKGNLIWGRSVVSSAKDMGDPDESIYENEFENVNNWISPHKNKNYMHAEINLNELNKKDNKCHLVKQFSWNEAKTKCDNVNIAFDQ